MAHRDQSMTVMTVLWSIWFIFFTHT